jgi:DNA polymerase-1
MARPRLFLLDSFNLIFRAFHARQRMAAPPMRTSRGTSTEAVYIFYTMLRRLLKQYKPDALAAAFESAGPTFRDLEFPAYKANRTETPPELIEQIPVIERLLGALRVPVLSAPGFEADDVIATMAVKAAAEGYDVWIISSDKDLLQLVGGPVSMMDPMKKDLLYDPEKVKEAKGVLPAQIPDLLALVGDTSDNIPGAPGIGEKGAAALLEQFGTVEAAIERAAEVSRKAYRESLENNGQQIGLSKRLATVRYDVPIETAAAALAVAEPDRTLLGELFREMEFFSFLKEIEPGEAPAAESGAPAVEVIPDTGARLVYDWKGELVRHPEWIDEPPPEPVDDVLLYGFLVLADPSGCSLASLMARYLDRPMEPEQAIASLAHQLRPLIDAPLRQVYDTIDLPLAPVLARMELAGIRIDPARLSIISAAMETEIARLTTEIFTLAGHEFNINSPQQLGLVLFDEMGIPSQGRTGKTKNYSTAADVLESLAPFHPVAQLVLDYRQLTKLKGTYVDALPALVSPEDGRLHTTFNPAGAATGRLSSSNPNLQNIPIRTEQGRAIRAAFVPEPGWTLLVADYSQIELRLLAHFSRDPVLTDAFRNNEDIHTRTASEVFGVPPLMVTPEMRRNAKAVNFGIVYGQTAFGLASQLGIPREEAESYIRGYFERYAGVKKWIDATIAEVRKSGHTVTLHGRRRPIPDIEAKNQNARSFAERTAVNTPLQGTAADLIKLAMIAIDRDLKEGKMQSRMLLQVHDELVVECPPDELDEMRKLVKRRMEGVVKLNVPLLVDTGTGENWRDAK